MEYQSIDSMSAYRYKYGISPMQRREPATAQEAVVMLQHIIIRHQDEPDVVFEAAKAIPEIVIEAAHNGQIVDPLMGA